MENKHNKLGSKTADTIPHPIGLIPQKFYDEKVNKDRIHDIVNAMGRFSEAKVEIPIDWVEEFNARIKLLK